MRVLFAKRWTIAVVCLFSVVLASLDVQGVDTINWLTTSTNQVLRQSDGVTPISAGQTNSATAGFAQLIWIGSDGYDGWTAVNDAVVDTSWVGANIMFDFWDGRIKDTYTNSVYTPGNVFVVRFFENPSPNYAIGALPTTGDYGISGLFTNLQDGTSGTPPPETFTLTGTLVANMAVVPEPGTTGLLILGLSMIPFRRMIRKRKS